eukprot:gene6344-biopygen4015
MESAIQSILRSPTPGPVVIPSTSSLIGSAEAFSWAQYPFTASHTFQHNVSASSVLHHSRSPRCPALQASEVKHTQTSTTAWVDVCTQSPYTDMGSPLDSCVGSLTTSNGINVASFPFFFPSPSMTTSVSVEDDMASNDSSASVRTVSSIGSPLQSPTSNRGDVTESKRRSTLLPGEATRTSFVP